MGAYCDTRGSRCSSSAAILDAGAQDLDLSDRAVPVIRLDGPQARDDVHTALNAAEDGVLAIEMRRRG